MLNPNSRSLYTSALTPPPGMVFDEAIATTFSMDPALLLEAPVYLALMAADGQADPDPLSVLEAIRRYSKRITVYVQKRPDSSTPDRQAEPVVWLSGGDGCRGKGSLRWCLPSESLGNSFCYSGWT